MSSLFKQISQEAAQQRSAVQEIAEPSAQQIKPDPVSSSPEVLAQSPSTPNKPQDTVPAKKVAPQRGTVAPRDGTNSPQLDSEKLRLIIQQIAQMPTNSNGLNVRMSAQEMQAIEDFVLGTLRKEGLKGHDVSIAKLMRYALRYMFRVHQKEFVAALREALKVEETLSI
jgi:hypothetical protein